MTREERMMMYKDCIIANCKRVIYWKMKILLVLENGILAVN